MSRVFKVAITAISLTMFANFLFTAGVGVYRAFHGYFTLYTDGANSKPGLEILESLDLFLVALVFLILSLGFMKLFYPDFKWFSHISLPWLKVEDFVQLKHLTWNAMLLTLLIIFGAQVLRANGQLDWDLLIIPISVVLFSLAGKLLKH
jgi:uncharacterized membrane protein YqhA